MRCLGWRFTGAIPNVAKGVAIVAPHTSNWDFLIGVAAMFALGLKVEFLGKHTLFKWPIGPVMRWLGGIPVDRRSSSGVVEETVALFERKDQLVLGLSPEGTRSAVDRWKTGFYFVAVKAGVPIIPVAFDYRHKVIRIGERFDPSGEVETDIGRLEAFFLGIEGRREN